MIPNLPNLHFLAFGKGLRAERPILLRRDFDPKKKAASERLRRPLFTPIASEAAHCEATDFDPIQEGKALTTDD